MTGAAREDRPAPPDADPDKAVVADESTGLAASSPRNGQRRLLVIEGDDLGLLHAFNEGIRAAYCDGVLSSTCLRANGYAYDAAVEEVLPACPGLGVGVHLCLNEAEPVAPAGEVPALLDRRGQLRSGYFWLMRLARTAAGLRQIEIELRAQIEKVLGSRVRPDHLNSHQHVHMIAPIFRLVCRLAREYGVPAVRLTRELPHRAAGLRKGFQPYLTSNIFKHVLLNRLARTAEAAAFRYGRCSTDYFAGVRYTAHMNLRAVLAGLAAATHGSVEMLLHPALGPDPRDTRYPNADLRRYVLMKQRRTELRSLRSPRLAEYLRGENWEVVSFAELARLRPPRELPMRAPLISDETRQVCAAVELRCPPWVSAAQSDSRVFAELAAALTAPGQRIADIGTGTGVIAICLARLGRAVVASDISAAAVSTARENALRNGVQFECVVSDLLLHLPGPFDLIAFNLPYGFGPDNLATNTAKHFLRKIPFVRQRSGLAMPRPVLRYHQQLVAQLAGQAPARLTPGGALLLHAYESEVKSLTETLPNGAEVELFEDPRLAANRTVGMVVRFPAAGGP